MNKRNKYRLFSAVIFIVFVALNPSEKDHEDAVIFNTGSSAESFLRGRTTRLNLIICSFTKVNGWNYKGESTRISTVGIGILGQVYIFSEVNK